MPPRVAPAPSNGDANSVYYVHPSEGLNSVTITPQLNGSNYLSWSVRCNALLAPRTSLCSSMDRFLLLRFWISTVQHGN
ncbi:hypothetical protein A2U01_0085732, partial [Trifolium medium]|nr:hypothetical protein [Trifolium medium]